MATVLWSSDDFYTGSARRMPRIMVPISGSGEVPIWHMADGYAYRLWDRGMSGEPGRGSNWITYSGETKAKIFGWQITRPFKYAGQTGPISVMFHTYNSTPSNRHRVYLGIAILKPNGTYVQQQNIHHIDIAETSRTVIASSKSFQPGDRLIIQLGRSVIHAGQSAHLNYGKNLTRVEFPADVIFDTDPYDVTPVPPVEPDPEEVPQENEGVVPAPVDDGWSGPAPLPPQPGEPTIDVTKMTLTEVYTPALGAGAASTIYGNGIHVMPMTGNRKGLSYSYDALEWFSAPVPFALSAGRIAYGGGRFVAISDSKAWFSYDAVAWQELGSVSIPYASPILYANGRFVAFSGDRTALISTSGGETWSSVTLASARKDIGQAATNGSTFLYWSGDNYNPVYSSDGLTWTRSAPGLVGPPWMSGDAGKYVARRQTVQKESRLSTDNGATWQVKYSSSTSLPGAGHKIEAGFGGYVTTGTNLIGTSSDLEDWTSKAVPQLGVSDIGHGDRKFVVGEVAARGRTYVLSEWPLKYDPQPTAPKQIYWTRLEIADENQPSWQFAHVAGVYIACVFGRSYIYKSTNMREWQKVDMPEQIRTAGGGGGRFVAVGSSGKMYRSVNGTDWITDPEWPPATGATKLEYVYQIDGFIVTRASSNYYGRINSDMSVVNEPGVTGSTTSDYHQVLAVGNDLVLSSNRLNKVSVRHVQTASLHIGSVSSQPPGSSTGRYELTYGNGVFVQPATSGRVNITKNGMEWESVIVPELGTGYIYKLAYGENMFVGTNLQGTWTSSDGKSWSCSPFSDDKLSSPNWSFLTYTGEYFLSGLANSKEIIIGSVNPEVELIGGHSSFVPTITIS